MSYARFASDSDVYVFRSNLGFECCLCLLQKREWVDDDSAPLGGWLQDVGEHVPNIFDTPQQMISHLQAHITVGHLVPGDAIERLGREADR